MDIEQYLHIAVDVASGPAEVERLDTYADRRSHYQNNNYTYVPMPPDEKYYNTDEGWLRDLSHEQIIKEDCHIMDVLRGLQRHPFLLVDHNYGTYIVKNGEFLAEEFMIKSNSIIIEGLEIGPDEVTDDMRFRSWELESEYPDLARENLSYSYDERYGIITLADLNKRPVKEMIYPVVAKLENELTDKIRTHYPKSEELFETLRAETVGRWYKDRMKGLELHVSEHMNLVEIKTVIQGSSGDLLSDCGFASKSQVDKQLGGVNELRNSVMHANRTLIYTRTDVEKVIDRIERAQNILRRIQ